MKFFFHFGKAFSSVRAWLGKAAHRSSELVMRPSLMPWLPLKPNRPLAPYCLIRPIGGSSSKGYVAPQSIDQSGQEGNSTSAGQEARNLVQAVRHLITCGDNFLASEGFRSRIVSIEVS